MTQDNQLTTNSEEDDLQKSARGSLFARALGGLKAHFPPGQFGRYLAVGICNTIFGYSVYAVLTALFTGHVPFPYVLASLLSGLINFTFAYVNYKFFIFKTRGNYLREWFRCVLVYSSGLLVGTAILPLGVFAVRHLTSADKSAPYIAGALLTSVNVVAGFLGHKNYSFASPSAL